MSTPSAHEIRALARIVDELDYYRILQVEPGASSAEIKRAYYQCSRAYHPDSSHNRGLDGELRQHCDRIAKRVTEAYCVLRDRRRRTAYDAQLGADRGARMPLAEARAEHKRARTEELQGRTPQGRNFFQRAMQDLERGNTKAAIQHLQMALTFEPDNAGFKERIEALRTRG